MVIQRVLVSVGLFTLLLAFGIADAVLLEGVPQESFALLPPEQPTTPVPTPEEPRSQQEVRRAVVSVIQEMGFELSEASDQLFLPQVIDTDEVRSATLLHANDRAGAIAWVEASAVQVYYLALKEALHAAFTPEVRDLVDRTERRNGAPTRSVLMFHDHGISEERILFARVENFLLELHVREGNEDLVGALFERLTE